MDAGLVLHRRMYSNRNRLPGSRNEQYAAENKQNEADLQSGVRASAALGSALGGLQSKAAMQRVQEATRHEAGLIGCRQCQNRTIEPEAEYHAPARQRECT